MRTLYAIVSVVLTLLTIWMVVRAFRKSTDVLAVRGTLVWRQRNTEIVWIGGALLFGVLYSFGHGMLVNSSYGQVPVADDPFSRMVPAPWTQLPLYMAFWPSFAAATGTVLFFVWRLVRRSRRRPTFESLV